MKLYISIWICFLLSLFFPKEAQANIASTQNSTKNISIDSILTKTILYAPFYENIVGEYKADVYLKCKMDIKKKNMIIRFIPSMFKREKGVKKYLIESYSEIHYTAPNIYDQKIKACVGTVKGFNGLEGDALDYFHTHIYSSTLLNKKILSPLASNGQRYYQYKIDSILDNSGKISYKVKFTPKTESYQLVSGYMIISDGVWSVREVYITGRSEYRFFNIKIEMGNIGADDECLPLRYNINTSFRFLGNVLESNYSAVLKYQSIKYQEIKLTQKKNYNLTESYTLQCDTSMFQTNLTSFEKFRPIDLNTNEKKLYTEYGQRNNSLVHRFPIKEKKWDWVGETGNALTSNYYVNLFHMGNIKFSPLLNPFLMSYSANDGFAYRQSFKYSRLFSGDRLLLVTPKIGYNFKRKELYWSANADYDYWPRKKAAIHFSIGNGNRIYSSEVLEDLKAIPDSIFDFDKIQLAYFRDLYINFNHSLEITNGLLLNLGLSAHKRTAIKSTAPVDSLIHNPNIKDKYISFAPRIRLSWTPGQYYYMNGERKVNLYSDYPTFSVDWEKGIKGIFKSSGNYERIELDIQHQLSIGLMRNIFWRFGCGTFTNQKQVYFVDFANFSKNNLPVGWNDEIGGVFQLLDRRWYNSSQKYVRGHLTYEAPFLFIPHFVKYTRNVINERLYANFLVVPHLKPYLEFGYGIGTHIFDLGIFASNVNGKFSEIGCKFTFELFNR
ncbi:DUF5686 family protein [uncultured Bacteroides sp.]|uniref:DUF5686 family protein n=1 Tax=uncultured Bacteroides sp. TaxID=162156 RepID=UPI003749D6E9